MLEKTCFKCGETKPIEMFHKHPQMKSGRLNKCGQCTVADVRKWKDSKISKIGKRAYSNMRYERAIEMGSLTRKRSRKEIAEKKYSEEERVSARRKSIAKCLHKRRVRYRCSNLTELDTLVIDEAFRLRDMRIVVTGFGWHVDHIIPINSKIASGLHNGHNIQVVPAIWNLKKGHRTMDRFFDPHSATRPQI